MAKKIVKKKPVKKVATDSKQMEPATKPANKPQWLTRGELNRLIGEQQPDAKKRVTVQVDGQVIGTKYFLKDLCKYFSMDGKVAIDYQGESTFWQSLSEGDSTAGRNIVVDMTKLKNGTPVFHVKKLPQ